MKMKPAWAAGFLIAGLCVVCRIEVSAENSSLSEEKKRQEQAIVSEEPKVESSTQQEQASKEEKPVTDRTLEESLMLARTEVDFLLQKLVDLVRRNESMGIESLTDEQQALSEKFVKLAGELSRSEKEKNALEKALSNVVTAHEALEKAGNNAEKSAARKKYDAALQEASKILKGQENSPIPVADGLSDAVVVDVDESGKILVVNAGKNQGMKVGMSFYLVRRNEVMGECQIMEVREYLSAALYKGGEKEKNVQLGDHLIPVVAEE